MNNESELLAPRLLLALLLITPVLSLAVHEFTQPVTAPRTIGSACTMAEATFDAETAKRGGEKTAWYWLDAQGKFCADMHHVNNPDAGMDDWRSVSIEPAGYHPIFDRQEDAVKWVNSQPYGYNDSQSVGVNNGTMIQNNGDK